MEDADRLGRSYEESLDPSRRRRLGAHYTPAAVADRLAGIALAEVAGEPRVCDPACGAGAFLLAAGRHLEARGLSRGHVVRHLLWGADIDAGAVAECRSALTSWSGVQPGSHVTVADPLASGMSSWPDLPSAGFDAVIGNPPFLSPLRRRTSRGARESERLLRRFGDVARVYADTAWIFLAAAVELARPGGRVLMIQPQSLLASRDGAGARRAVLERAALEGLWMAADGVFGASVRLSAPVLRVGGVQPTVVRCWSGPDGDEEPPVRVHGCDLAAGASWAPVAAASLGIPDVELSSDEGRLGDLASATAGFRDEFYGLAPYTVDRARPAAGGDEGWPRLVTCGLIEPGRVAWDERPVRFAGRRFEAPRVDFAALTAAEPRLGRWVRARLVPKVVVATQTRVVEAAVDAAGQWVPSTPVVSVEAPPPRLAHIAAALLAPPVTAWALRRCAGTALSHDSVKLSARQVLEVPLPRAGAEWDRAADVVAVVAGTADPRTRRAALLELGAAMTDAYGEDEAVLEWWAARLPAIGR